MAVRKNVPVRLLRQLIVSVSMVDGYSHGRIAHYTACNKTWTESYKRFAILPTAYILSNIAEDFVPIQATKLRIIPVIKFE